MATALNCGGLFITLLRPNTSPDGEWRLTRQSRGGPRPALPLGRGPRPFPRSPLRDGREACHSAFAPCQASRPPRSPGREAPSATLRALSVRASGRAVAGKPAFFFIGYARRSGRPVLCTRHLSDRLLRDASDVGGCGLSDCVVVGAVALLWTNNLKLSANHRCRTAPPNGYHKKLH